VSTSDDPYAVLGLDRTATMEQVQAAYRERSRRYHPDVGGDAWAFKKVQEAFDAIVVERNRSDDSAKSSDDGQASAAPPAVSPEQKNWFERLPDWQQAAIVVGTVLLIIVGVFGISAVLWLLCGLAVVAAAIAYWYSRHAETSDERYGLWVISGVLIVVGIGIWFVTGWLDDDGEPSPRIASQPFSETPHTNATGTSSAEPDDPYGWVPRRGRGVVKAVAYIYERFGFGGAVAAVVIAMAAYGVYDEWRSKSKPKGLA
jgi:hypothetical protein